MKTNSRRGWTIGAGGILALALWFGWMTWFTDSSIRRFEQSMREVGTPAAPGEAWRTQRFFVEPDAYYWLSYARELRERGAWRMRTTQADNAPYGREMHWSHLVIWGLMGLGRLIEATTGTDAAQALELAGRTLLPLAGVVFLSGLFLLLGRRLGWLVAGLTVGALATTIEIQWDFNGLRPDHHGFQLAFAAGMWLCLALGGMGWVRKSGTGDPSGSGLPDPRSARGWFRLSGLLGGMALWLGATVFLFSLFATAIGAAFTLLVAKPDAGKEAAELDPGVWRTWAIWGAMAGLFFYALEYAPHHLGMRLEVNHPLYALCWLGTGECLRTLFSWKKNAGRLDAKSWGVGLAGLLAAAALPLLILFGPVEWYWLRTEIMWRLTSQHIVEFYSLSKLAGAKWPMIWLQMGGVGILSLFGVAWMIQAQRMPIRTQAALAGLWAIAAFFTGLYFWQVRWASFALTASLLLTAFWLAALLEQAQAWPKPDWRRWIPAVVAILLVLQGISGAVKLCTPLVKLRRVEKIDSPWLKALLQRNLMVQLKQRGNGQHLRLMLPAEMAPAAWYFGVGDSVGSLYWENPVGLAAAAEFLGDALPGERARGIAKERAITHVLLNIGATDAMMFYQLATGRLSEREAMTTVGGAVAQSGAPVPAWLELDAGMSAAASRVYEIAVPLAGGWVPVNLPVQVVRVKN
jgi:hypothetical protein